METKPSKERRKYNATFKREAVANWVASGKTAEAVGRELGIGAERLYTWKSQFMPPTAVEAANLQAQLQAVQRAGDTAQGLARDVGVDRGGLQLLVPEENLDRSEVDVLL